MRYDDHYSDVIFENDMFRLTAGGDAVAKSLLYKPLNEECLAAGEGIALFSVTQERPYNNEIKLAHPNKRTVFEANSLRRDGDRLLVGFELVPYDALLQIKETPNYIAFKLLDFVVHPESEPGIVMDYPPVSEMRLIQLPVRNRANFGEWLNVSWDDRAAVGVLAVSPYAAIDSERRKGYRVMTADAVKNVKLKGVEAALIVCGADRLLDCIGGLERDYNLPRGAESRKGKMINASYYWTGDAAPENIDEHIRFARAGGFRCMSMYYTCFFKEDGYQYEGNYEYRDEYPNGVRDVAGVLEKIKAAGIVPGLHFLHTHIGLKSRYVTPTADHRLGLTRRFTLARPLGERDGVIYTEQNPEGAPMADECRVLQIGGELVTYAGYSAEWPYRFDGVRRGAFDTAACWRPAGFIFGVLDVSEFGAQSVYLDQNSSLQDEIAEKIADVYNAGFQYVYFDGAEGVQPPFGFHVPNAQYRVYKRFNAAPLFAESAAKAHFSWHMLSGGNAFDIFPPEAFKAKIRQFPAEEAPRMRQDFTRLNFGWWGYWSPGTQPDMLEYGTSRAAAWDCPVALMSSLPKFREHPRTPDNLEVMRRWEDARAAGWLTEEHKSALRNLDQEHILLIDEDAQFELAPYDRVEGAAGGSAEITAYVFERKGASYAVYWHNSGEAALELPAGPGDIALMKDLGAEIAPVSGADSTVTLPLAGRMYVKSSLPKAALIEAFKNAKII